MALKCAALVAGHPDPDGHVTAWLAKLRRSCRVSSKLARLVTGPSPPANLSKPWKLAASRNLCGPRRRRKRFHSPALERALLDAIHGLYLRALARLPAGELRARFHRSLLQGGHCYGPFPDPVANTVWYDAAFPRTHELELDVVGTMSLHRLETRSMCGLASFLCTRYRRLDFRQATCLLLECDANLLLADPNLDATAAAALLRKEERRPRISLLFVDDGTQSFSNVDDGTSSVSLLRPRGDQDRASGRDRLPRA